MAAVLVDRLGLQPTAFAASAAAAAVLALVFAWRPAEGIGAFLLFVLFADNWEYWFGSDLRLADEATVVLFGAVGLLRGWFPGRQLKFGPKEVLLAVVLAAGLGSSVLRDVPLQVWGPALILFFKAVVFLYLVSWLRLTIEDIERVGVVLGGAALVIAGLGFVEFLDPRRFQELFGLPSSIAERGEISVIQSLFLHPSLYGWLTVFASLFLYARYIVMRSWWTLPIALVLNIGTVLSSRRTALIGLVVALTTGLIWQLHRRVTVRAFLMVWIPLATAVLVVALAFLPALGRIYELTVAEYGVPREAAAEILSPNPDPDIVAAMHPRLALYVGAVAVSRDAFPLGAGLGRYGSHMSREPYSPVYGEYGLDRVTGLQPTDTSAVTDTFWPMLLGETGVIGAVAFGVFIVLLLVELWQTSTRAQGRRHRAFALGALMVFVESLVGSTTSATYVAPPIAYFVFAVVGANLSLSAPRQ